MRNLQRPGKVDSVFYLRYNAIVAFGASFFVLALFAIFASLLLGSIAADTNSPNFQDEKVGRSKFVARYALNASASAMAASRCGDSYRVRKGDTLAKIARKCDVKVSQLKRWNNLSSNRIRVNWVLKLRSPREIQKPPKDSAFEKAKILLDETVKKALPLPAFN